MRATDEPLTRVVVEALHAYDIAEHASAVVLDLLGGHEARWRANEDIYPASIIKLALMTEAYDRFASGSLSPDERVVVARANLTATSEPTPLVEGFTARLRELVELIDRTVRQHRDESAHRRARSRAGHGSDARARPPAFPLGPKAVGF